MSFTRSSAFIGLAGLGLWLLSAAPAQAGDAAESLLPAEVTSSTPSAASTTGAQMGTGNLDKCQFRGIRLAGKVKIVDSFPDIRVKAVRSFPDIKVKKVDSFADDCGEWQVVDSFPDFKIQFVDSFPDVEIAWVNSFPGLP